MRTCNNILSFRPGRTLILAGMLLLGCISAHSQNITIGGDIYGGGRQGAVGTAKAQRASANKDSVQLKAGALTEGTYTTEIKINSGSVRTVFGGGENGRTYGNTSVTIQGSSTQVGSENWQGSVYGGVFGAGDGESAYVFGHTNLFINGGSIVQNVYGGGNRADLMGSTSVQLSGGQLQRSVFGGARLANIYGYSFVNINGAGALNDLIISTVYGGNDIAGDINSSGKWSWTSNPTLPSVLGLANANNAFKTYNAFVFSSPEKEGKHIFVGQLYGGGNGDYEYTENALDATKLDMSELWDSIRENPTTHANDTSFHTFTVSKTPEVSQVYLELKGGTYGYVYGGGNSATVTGNVDICLNNQTLQNNIHTMALTDLENMGLNYDESDTAYTITGTGTARTLKSKYQFDRVFGGNNKVAMNLQPTWHITKASINNLYSGGNAGDMTYSSGLLLTLTSPDLEVNNVYGGCRRADVEPNIPEGESVTAMSGTVDGFSYSFPKDHSARILIGAGKINNVYGGNDISGKVKGGNAIDIQSSILGDVYGGGNGSYAYTDNAALKNDKKYGDFYYNPGSNTLAALNDYRPNAEQAWIHVTGRISGEDTIHTVIGGSLYLGGNSATLDISESDVNAGSKKATLKIGSYVIAKNVFLGSNGENMIDSAMLAMYDNGKIDNTIEFNSITMNQASFTEYIKGVSVGIKPKVDFDDDYDDNSTKIGSFFFGGNLGSVTASGTFDVTFAKPVIIFEKLVAGCNDANYKNTAYGIDYRGGITKAPTSGPKINMTLDGITLMPGKIQYDNQGNPDVVYNVVDGLLKGGNIFGGCYNSGDINGDVVIGLTSAAYDESTLFKTSLANNSGVTRDTLLNNVVSSALSMFGGGFGPNASIEGNTTINISSQGRILKVFGGGLQGPVNGNTTINLTGGNVGKIYGGGFEGLINGHTSVYLDGGTVHSAFGGACNADIRDYAQLFVGKKTAGVTTVQNSVYGGNDFGGSILGQGDFSTDGYVTTAEKAMAYHPDSANTVPNVLKASAYVEYVQGNIAKSIFGGSCGSYDYTASSPFYDHIIDTSDPLPHLASAFVHFKGNANVRNNVVQVFGAGEGAEGSDASANIQDKMQQRSYVLVNSTADSTFQTTDIYGAGAFSGLGMQVAQNDRSNLDAYSAVVDLMGGWINNAYGASYNEGVTRRTVVNAPAGSTARMLNLFGGGYGSRLTSPCDVYESHVNWNSEDARVRWLYGGNNNSRRTLYAFVNINSEAWYDKSTGFLTTVYGAGCGKDTWAEYTEVHLNNGALVYEVYGGGYGGKVLNLASVNAWSKQDPTIYTVIGSGYEDLGLSDHDLVWANLLGDTTNTNVYIHKGAEVGLRSDRRGSGIYPVTIGGGYGYAGGYGDYNDPSMGSVSGTTYIGLHGGIVWKDIYASGTLGGVYDMFKTKSFVAQSNAYIEGGSVRNVYGAGWKGRVGYTELPVTVDLNTTNVDAVLANDIPGIANVEIGIPDDRRAMVGSEWGFYKGVPTVERNAYSSGEDGGCVIGTSKLTIHNGYIGYRYYDIASAHDTPNSYETFVATDDPETVIDERYIEKTYDETWTFDKEHPNAADGVDRLTDSGNAFGGGYTDNATADTTIVTVWGGHIRNSVYGGGEVAAIGRGEANEAVGSAIRTLKGIYQSGATQVNVYSGYINRNVFGGGKGYNNNGTKGKLLTDGYVFGQTEVNIYGGEIGTDLTVLEGDGNVFGGGNIGYVFNTRNSRKDSDGYYYLLKGDGTNDLWEDPVTGEHKLSEDCRVIVTPYAKVLDPNGVDVKDSLGVTKHFNQFDFIPTSYLNLIPKNDDRWYDQQKDSGPIDQTGIIIHNAIFAGGNVSSGNELYANTKTVFGNATATINDLYYCDLITVGTEHIGGLYGDGNLTRVDGYRELNISNYGTDYYGMNTNRVTLEDYHKMNDRERAYFQLKYLSKKQFTWNGQSYGIETVLTKDEIKEKLLGATYNGEVVVSPEGEPSPDYWDEYGFVSIYAGRLINTLQRADFVGVFGSRMVMQGARDRVPETVDFTDYTINRVGEVSLNQVKSPLHEVDSLGNDKKNGNYFGIYNIVNHLAALTSDVDMENDRITEKTTDSLYLPKNIAEESYYGWKYANKLNRRRNDGQAANKVALASGVYLEITTENSTDENKVWGPITGVLELDLINVMPGLGGGYVYAKNVHGVRSNTGRKHITLSDYNKNAVSYKKYQYTEPIDSNDFQTSGNLVSSKTIIDDCYPTSDSYVGATAAEGHYWYIKGEIYVYDLYLSAYTGAAEAYSKTVSIPLTITAGSHGKITLQDVKPSKYMYYDADGETPLASDQSIILNNKTYLLNDTLSYWDWLQLSESDQKKFVDTTFVTVADFLVGTDTIHKGFVLSRKDYETYCRNLGSDSVRHVAKNRNVHVTEVFRMSNDMSHNKGYALTLELNNPEVWDKYYTSTSGLDKSTKQPGGFMNAPTYKVKSSGIYGQREYGRGDIITKDVYDTYQDLITEHPNDIPANSATFERAYVMNQDWSKEFDGIVRYFNKGLVMPDSAYRANGIGDKADLALFCTETWKLEATNMLDEYVFYGTSMTEAEIRQLGATYSMSDSALTVAIGKYFSPAYYCTRPGKYGGNYYVAGNNYIAKTAWSAMNPEDRKNFEFNYDAFDVLIDSTFSGSPALYDGKNGVDPTGQYVYSSTQPIDYTAKYVKPDAITYIKPDNTTSEQIVNGQVMNRVQYESLPNEQYHYSPLKVGKVDSVYYIVKTPFTVGNTSYSVGNVISPATYQGFQNTENLSHIEALTGFPTANKKYYYCRESYTVGQNGAESGADGEITDVMNSGHPTYSKGDVVPAGTIIDETGYANLPNIQKNFTIHGKTPVGVSTLYVSGQSNIQDLSKGRVYTVTYLYDYEESDEEGNNINQVNEKHVVNIHVMFQGGTPTISQISNPPTVLPGSTVGMTQPRVTPGAYEVIGGGWEIFVNEQDANNHENGAEFENGNTPLYWYNNNYYLAYYAKTYLGKTYSNVVPFKVGNYHELSRVMKDSLHHMYVDHPNVDHNSKIYLAKDKYDKDTIKNELDMLKDFFDLSMYDLTYTNNNPDTIKDGSQLNGYIPMNKYVKGGQHIDFILKTDIAPLAYTDWTPIGAKGDSCFEGTLHGDGHTISGLNKSLFGYLCGDVYNLGVTGTFTSSGIADNGGGSIENAWINTTGTVTSATPIFGGSAGTVINGYYPQEITGYTAREGVTARPYNSFHNGEVAYDLNGFYLAKRYAKETNAAGDNKYYYTIANNTNNRLSELPEGFVQGSDYVAMRYADGDFIYASGSIPEQANERMYNVEPAEGEEADPKYKHYFPIFPDDYIFFGQMLTYGYSNIRGEEYQQYPSSINRADRNSVGDQHYASQWIVREEVNSTSNVKSNRVYRAPAYFGNSTMGLAHFNANAFLPDSTKNRQQSVYPGMTAFDLTGYNDDSWNNGWSGGLFMTKVLDYNYLTGFRSDGQTRNLLVYTPYGTNTTNTILTTYLADQNYSMGDYNTVEVLDYEYESRVKGHLVHKGSFVQNDNDYHAAGNQFLVDKQNFNAPIEYNFEANTHMWYQRTPERFVESMDAGWDVISLPFTAEYVTTQTKGELTHFYSTSKDGHEYWLREFNKIDSETQNNVTTSKAMFKAPDADSDNSKIYGNTFLWDYYYSRSERDDKNEDKYYEYYSENDHEYEGYPFNAAGQPYLIGLPGLRFYEFDLSGQFLAKNTYSQPGRLTKQTLTFISPDDGTTIKVTDTEYASSKTLNTHDGYVFTPTYQAQDVTNAYLIANDGASFKKTAQAKTVPFRAYMTAAPSQGAQQRAATRATAGTDILYIGYTGTTDPLIETPVDRGLSISGQHMQITIESTLDVPATVNITTTAGKLLKQFVIQPGTKVTVPVNSRGIYIVNRHKIAVTK